LLLNWGGGQSGPNEGCDKIVEANMKGRGRAGGAARTSLGPMEKEDGEGRGVFVLDKYLNASKINMKTRSDARPI
jgi:hypothetical protein